MATTQVKPAPRLLSTTTATLIVVANMLGTGIFSTSGIVLNHIQSAPALLLAWLICGALTLCGALAYAELFCLFPANGGEYLILSRIYHPALGFIAGFVSFFVGFAAPVAAAALAFSSYMSALWPDVLPLSSAWILVVALSILQMLTVSLASRTLDILTAGKVALMGAFIIGGLWYGNPQLLTEAPSPALGRELLSPSFAVSLILVSFAYSGWSAVSYMAGEFRNPSRTIPIALISGCVIVVILYVSMNIVYLMAAPIAQMAGVVEIGHLVAIQLFGPSMGKFLSLTIALGLISTVSAMIMAGPRVYEAMGHDYKALHFLTFRPKRGGPALAIAMQGAAALLMVVTASFDAILAYAGFLLMITSALTVIGVFIMRYRAPDQMRTYRTWGYPITPLLFVVAMGWSLANTLIQKPYAALAGLATVVFASIVYLAVRSSHATPLVKT